MGHQQRTSKLAAIGLAVAIPAIASANASELSWSGWRPIQEIAQESGSVVFVLSGAKIVAPSACMNKFRIDPNDPDAPAKIAALNSAYSTARRIDVSFVPDTTACSVLVFELAVEP